MVIRPIKESAPLLDLPMEVLWNDEHLDKPGHRFVKVLKEFAWGLE
jgi:hypothetical protein